MNLLKRLAMIFLTVAALFAAATAALVASPAPAPATDATLAQAQATADALRAQLAKERRAYRLLASSNRARTATPSSVRHALQVAAATYGVPTERLRRVATCESTLNPKATNGRYVGLFQFGTPLWNTTPYAKFSRTDPYAAALAAAWAFSKGMASHWPECGRR